MLSLIIVTIQTKSGIIVAIGIINTIRRLLDIHGDQVLECVVCRLSMQNSI